MLDTQAIGVVAFVFQVLVFGPVVCGYTDYKITFAYLIIKVSNVNI